MTKGRLPPVNRKIVKFVVHIELSHWDNEKELDACEKIAALGLRLNMDTAHGCMRTITVEKMKGGKE